jgi:hypothetical protein
VFCIVMAVVLSGVFCSSHKMPPASTSLAGVGDEAVVCAWGQRSVSNRVWQQGQRANAPCWAHTEALASQFTSLRLSNAPPCSPPQRLGGRLSHAQLWHTQLLHTQLFYTQLSHTQLVHTHTQLFHNFHTHNPCTHNCFTVIDHTVLTHTQLFHIQLFLNLSIPHLLLCLSFLPRPASTFVSNYWKKLTCVVIRSESGPLILLFFVGIES